MKRPILVAGLALLACTAAHAQSGKPAIVTTQAFIDACNSSVASEKAFCQGFAQGVFDTYVISRHPKKSPEFICFKDKSTTRSQALKDFTAWVEKYPQYAEKSASDTILRYLAHAYPCNS